MQKALSITLSSAAGRSVFRSRGPDLEKKARGAIKWLMQLSRFDLAALERKRSLQAMPKLSAIFLLHFFVTHCPFYYDCLLDNFVRNIVTHGANCLLTVFQHGVAVEIVRVLPESPPPQLTNIFCNVAENAPNDVVSVNYMVDSEKVTGCYNSW